MRGAEGVAAVCALPLVIGAGGNVDAFLPGGNVGSAFLAKYTIERLCKEGYRIKLATRRPWLYQNLKTMSSPGQLELIATNIWNEQDVKKILEGCDYSINFCGQIIEKQVTFKKLHSDWPGILSKISNKLG